MVNVERAEPRTGALKLTQICKLKCMQNSHLINDIGSAPYHLVEPILKKKSAKSLKVIESNSPQIIPHSDPLWKSLVERDFSDRPSERTTIKKGKQARVPSRELYDIYSKEREEQRNKAAAKLRLLNKNLSMEKNKTKVKALNHIVIPTNNKKAQQREVINGGFKSSLLQKAKHQNRMRAQFMSQSQKNDRRRTASLNQVNSSIAGSGPGRLSLKQITKVTPAQLSSYNLKRSFSQRSPFPPIPHPRPQAESSSGSSPPRKPIDLSRPSQNSAISPSLSSFNSSLKSSSSPTKRQRLDSSTENVTTADEKPRKSNVYIYKS
ncbi:unnamed protein product [Ambrosiozyma monospora]|uniref:Unnamed protein product n=1 Tax=Ambrosiozyma monospora TaxID=43982 RepID=A0A9W6YP89_AMBMO|nr:unnamed protein product [Ambrosiozyma monospora]